MISALSWGQFSIATGGTNYTQDFNTLTNGTWTDNTTLTGWYARTDATASIITYGANTGTTTTGALYAFGVAGTNPITERALGMASSNAFTGATGTRKGYYGWRLRNNTGAAISAITIIWTGEQWRRENNAASHTLNLFYQTGTTVTNLTAGSWTAAPSTFTSPIVGATLGTALDGNAPANRAASISVTITVTVAAGDEIMLRWEDLNDTGNDHLMAIDDVTVNATPVVVPPVITSALNPSGTVGVPFSYQITATNSPTTFTCTSLPSGLTFDPATGIISGTLSAALSTTVTITASNSSGSDAETLNITIAPPPPPVLTGDLTITGVANASLTYTFIATNTPTSYTLASGSLPPGMSLNSPSFGVLGFLPTAAGTYNFSIKAENAYGSSIADFRIVIFNPTVLLPGDLAILAVNTSAATSSSEDEISFVCFQDLLPGTTIFFTDNGYERVSAGKWGNTEGIVSLTRNNMTLPKGTIITIHSVDNGINDPTDFTVSTCGSIDGNWTKGSLTTTSFDLNKDDQVWFMQGGTWANVATGNHDATYTGGNVLYGWTDIAWKTAPAWDVANGTIGSTIYPLRECFTTDVNNLITTASYVKFNDPDAIDFSSTTNGKLDWIVLINNTVNWSNYNSDTDYDTLGYNYFGATTCPAATVATDIYVNGKWTGVKDTNWFNCGNWDTLVVPDSTVDVQVGDNIYNNQATVDATAPFASYFGNIATAKNLTITGEKVEVIANLNNKLEVHGNLFIDAPAGALDMDDGTASADGIIKLKGNWTNSVGDAAFSEGNGTVEFVGTAPQLISSVATEGTEIFYNVILDNNFDTGVSNDLIASGNLTINSGRSVNIDSNGYINVYKTLNQSGDFTIQNNGQLIQVDDIVNVAGSYNGNNTGNIIYNRTASSIRGYDYVYWSSPVTGQDISTIYPSPGFKYLWNPLATNINTTPTNGISGNWEPAFGFMTPGKGYIVRGSSSYGMAATNIPATFTGEPNNGIITATISRGFNINPSQTGSNGTTVTNLDDNWNLVGNPYPSAINVTEFLKTANNPNIKGFIKIWTHGTAPVSTTSPFYNTFQYNYTANDYITCNDAGSTSGPSVNDQNIAIPAFTGNIASGQGFFVVMNDDGPTNFSTVTFNNSMRSRTYSNSQFYRSSVTTEETEEANRIWLDLVDPLNNPTRTLVGYFPEATVGFDRTYDAEKNIANSNNIYSIVEDRTVNIQGRPTPFDQNDQVPIGVTILSAGVYKIAIAAVDGLFEHEQPIYLEDKELNIIYDLRQSPYSFSSVAGKFNDRFVLRYTNTALGNPDFGNVGNSVIVASNQAELTIKSSIENIQEVTIYDVLGRQLFFAKEINNINFVTSNISLSQQTLIVKIKLENGMTISRKIIL